MTTAIVAQAPPGPYPALPFVAASSNINFAATDTSYTTGIVEAKTVVIVQNSGSVSGTITFTSVGDVNGRAGNVVDTLAGGKTAVYGPFRNSGWASGGNLGITVSTSLCGVGVLTMP